MQAAIGLLQLKKMPFWHQMRIQNARQIWAAADSIPALRVPSVPAYIEHAAYKCYVFVRPEYLKQGWNRDRIIAEFHKNGVPCFSGSCSEVYLEKAFEGTGFRPETRLPNARELGETSLMFLVHPTMSKVEAEKVCQVLISVVSKASKCDYPNTANVR